MRVSRADASSEQDLAARSGGWMMLAGSFLGVVTVILPPHATGSDSIILALTVFGIIFGSILLFLRKSLPQWVLIGAVITGIAMVTIATEEGGFPDAKTGTGDNEMFFVWISLLAFNFLSARAAIAQLVLTAAAYAWLLRGLPFDESITRWLVTTSTLAVAGALVWRLRTARDRVVGELFEQVSRDGLTGLLNRMALEERAKMELARCRRDGTPLSLIVLDVDHFKELNDTHGHPHGDRVLRRVSEVLGSETRQIDALARLGGDEFAVLLPGASGEDAEFVAKRLREVLAAGNGTDVTLSIGVSAGPPADHTFETLWHEADSAMYRSKRAGGDRVSSLETDSDEHAAVTAA
jgi:diguanylate cyclase (GGDEF)-like protein